MSSPSLVYVLVEDQRQRQLIYRFLVKTGFKPHQMSFTLSPSGQGSAEQWVRENFARQAGKCRARNARAATGMIVMLDADMRTVQERLDALGDALACAGQQPIDRNRDPIARLIPKRNVETWILCLGLQEPQEQAFDEDNDYKQAKTGEEWSKLIPPAVDKLFEWTQPKATLPVNLIGSLKFGIQELPRALHAIR
jgi:hypothetical protein